MVEKVQQGPVLVGTFFKSRKNMFPSQRGTCKLSAKSSALCAFATLWVIPHLNAMLTGGSHT